MATQAAPYTLRFTEWQCGHHGERPADIPVHSIEQANLILSAISHAISQPGHARAALFDGHMGTTVYLTDDYAEAISWVNQSRTTLYLASAAELEELRGLKDAFDYAYGGTLTEWDGKTWLDDLEVVTTLSQAEVEAAIAPVWWHEADHRRSVCDIPPTILPAETLLAELRQFREELAADGVQEGGAA
ncbi:hypothetical protein [Pseudacidovorax intermedius]|uniref:hypothetical protein n=1 Tax=Pseudacidovorax intermedius TaxID=433924 RepID=UPI0026F0D010|nr:hypothetical protein [Pseudacidovorax intermedius]